MSSKKKSSPKHLGDSLSSLLNRSLEVISDLATATATTSADASLASAKHLVSFQKMSAKAGLGLVSKVRDYSEKTLKEATKDGKWMPREGREVVDEWSAMMKSGIDEMGRVIEKSFDLMSKYIDRVEKERKSKTAPSPSKPKVAAKKSPAKKSPAKKSPAKKSPAKKKSAAAKKAS